MIDYPDEYKYNEDDHGREIIKRPLKQQRALSGEEHDTEEIEQSQMEPDDDDFHRAYEVRGKLRIPH